MNLHDAARTGDAERVRQLLQDPVVRAAINQKDAAGRTALHWAALNGHRTVAELLLGAGADPKTPDAEGRTPEQLCAPVGRGETDPAQADVHRAARAATRRRPDRAYPFVWMWPGGRTLRVTAWLVLFFLLAGTIVAVNPSVPGNWGWNTIELITEPRAGSGYQSQRATALAGSGRWLAVVADDGQVFMLNADSRLSRTLTRGALDVSAGLTPGQFWVLRGTGEIARFEPGWVNAFPAQVWLAAPKAERFWPRPADAGDRVEIVATEVEPAGWLLAIRGQGVARYRLRDGTVRERSWHVSKLGAIPLDRAVITEKTVWLSLKEGGLRAVHRDTLDERPDGRADTPKIVRLDADRTADWAVATDESGGLWIHSGGADRWRGPFFGSYGSPDPGPSEWRNAALMVPFTTSEIAVNTAPGSPAAVASARLTGSVPFMVVPGTGLLGYDRRNRRTVGATPDFDAGAPLPGPGGVLWFGNAGLFRTTGPDAAGRFTHVRLADARPIATDLSANAKLCAFLLPNGSARAITDPFGQPGGPVTLAPGTGWKSLTVPPEITGVEEYNGRWVFTTTTGAFIYNPADRTYTDVSKGQTAQKGNTTAPFRAQPLAAFAGVQGDRRVVVAVADRTPVRLEQYGATHIWTNLDPTNRTEPIEVVRVAPNVIGLGKDFQLHRYPYAEGNSNWDPVTACDGRVRDRPSPPRSDPLIGDLIVRGNGGWALTFFHDGTVYTYSPEDATIQKHGKARVLGPGVAPRNLRRFRESVLLVAPDGSVWDADKTEPVFGSGTIPFALAPAPAACAGPDAGQILVAGPDGELVQYNWAPGAWTALSPPFPESDGTRRRVVELGRGSGVTFARGESGALAARRDGGNWRPLDAYARWVASADGKRLWLAGANGVWSGPAPLPDDIGPDRSTGSGMRDFLKAAACAWQPDPQRVLFIGRDGSGRVYWPQTDVWKTVPLEHFRNPQQFVPDGQGGLLVLDGGQVLRLDAALKTEIVAALPLFAAGATITSQNGDARVAFVEKTAAELWVRPRIAGRLQNVVKYRYGSDGTTTNIDPSEVAFVRPLAGGNLLFVETNATISKYEPAHGRFTVLSRPGTELIGWSGSGDFTTLLVREGSSAKAVPVIAGKPGDPIALTVTGDPKDWAKQLEAARAFPFKLDTVALPGLHRPDDDAVPYDGAFGPVKGDKLTVRRVRGKAVYRAKVGNVERNLTPGPGGFAEDRFLGVGFTATGELWALQSDADHGLIRLDVRDGVLRPSGRPLDAGLNATALTAPAPGYISVETGAKSSTFVGGPNGLSSVEGVPDREQARVAPGGGWRVSWVATRTGLETVLHDPAGRKALAEWDADTGRFAWARIADAAWSPGQKSLLLATPFGVVERDPDTFALLGVQRQLSAARFVRKLDGTVVRIENGGRSYRWEAGTPGRAVADTGSEAHTDLSAGPWRWRVRHERPDRSTVAVAHAASGAARKLVEIEPGAWRFADDTVTCLARPAADDGGLYMATRDGLWPLTSTGRGGAVMLLGSDVEKVRCPTGPHWWWATPEGAWGVIEAATGKPVSGGAVPEAEIRVHNPAITVTLTDGRVQLAAADRASAPGLVEGRLYHDNTTALASFKGGLYALVAGRCVLQRNPAKPAEVLATWPLPPELRVESPNWALQALAPKPGADPDRLRVIADTGDRKLIWEFVPGAADWKSVPDQPIPTAAVTGMFVWRRPRVGAPLEPYAVRAPGTAPTVPITPPDPTGTTFVRLADLCAPGDARGDASVWWSGDRFAWDRVTAIGALGPDTAVLVTPIGPMSVPVTGSPPGQPTRLWPVARCATAGPARHAGGKRVGVLVGTRAGADWLLARSTAGAATMDPRPPEVVPVRPTVFLEQVAAVGQGVDFHEAWRADEPARKAEAIDSVLPAVPGDELFVAGQFGFDRADLACPLPAQPGGARRWVTVARVPSAKEPTSLVCVSGPDPTTGEPFRLFHVRRVPGHFRAMRPAGTDQVFALRSDRSEVVRLGVLTELAQPVPLESVRGPFRTGTDVRFDTTRLTWTQQPVYAWADVPGGALAAHPADGPVFTVEPRQAGSRFFRLALAADVLTSVAVCDGPSGPVLAVGTRGGVLLAPARTDTGDEALSYPHVRATRPGAGALADVGRVRFGQGDVLWARPRADEATAHVLKEPGDLDRLSWSGAPRPWATNRVTVRGRELFFPAEGGLHTTGGTVYATSNNAWWSNRLPIRGVVDVYADEEAGVVWACGDAGVFRILPERLSR